MDANEMNVMTLAEFCPEQVFYAAIGTPMGVTLDLVNGEDDSTGETYQRDADDVERMLPERWWDLTGVVSADGLVWNWDGKDEPRDWRQNTVTQLTADRSNGGAP